MGREGANMGLNFGQTPNIFPNAREEELGIAYSERTVTTAAVSLAASQYELTAAFTEIAGMSVAHESKTGKVLVIFTCTANVGVAEEVLIKLQKDGVDIPGAIGSAFAENESSQDIPTTIHYVETNAAKNTWRAVGKATEVADDSFIDDRVISVIDI